MLERVKQLEEDLWMKEASLTQLQSMTGGATPKMCREGRRPQRDMLVEALTRQAQTISRLQEQLRVFSQVP